MIIGVQYLAVMIGKEAAFRNSLFWKYYIALCEEEGADTAEVAIGMF